MELFVVALYAHSASKLAIARINTLHRAQIHIPMPLCAQVHLITDTSTAKAISALLPRIIGRTPPVEGDSHIFFSYFDILYSFRSWRHIVRHFSNLNKRNYGLDMKKYWWYLHVESNCVLRWGIAKWYTQNAQKTHIASSCTFIAHSIS